MAVSNCGYHFTRRLVVVIVRFYSQQHKGENDCLKYNHKKSVSNTLPQMAAVLQRQEEHLSTSLRISPVFTGCDDDKRNGNCASSSSMATDSQYFVLDHDVVARDDTITIPF